MQAIRRFLLKLTIASLLVAAVFCSGLDRSAAYAAPCAATTFRDLWAKTGSATLYGSTSVTIWGYSLSSGGAATLPGPVLVVNQGDCVQVTLHNSLAESSALLFQGQSLIPDTTGAPAGGSQVYTFAANRPGTFLYEAGLIPNTQHQVAMGLYGALIVRPTVPSAVNVDKTLVLSEFDTALAANPSSYDMRKYAPRYFLINGKAYPDTDLPANQISAAAGNTVLLRYVNAGLQAHAMSTLGLTQKAIATDGSAFAHPHSMISETIAPGQTLDALVSIPASAAAGTKYALYDANLLLRNANSAGLGGMLTFLTVPGALSGHSGPSTTAVALTPNPSDGLSAVTLTATIASGVTAAEYFVDVVGANGTGCPITGSLTSVNATIPVSGAAAPCVDLADLTNGNHTFYVHGTDGVTWGTIGSAVLSLNLDIVGPTTSALSLAPNPTNGTAVGITGSASDSATGNHNIAAAEYWIDSSSHIAMTVNVSAPTAGLSATIPTVAVNALTAGSHTVSVRSQDASSNWGPPATISLKVDKTGPATISVSASPNPNNGSTPYNSSVPAVRVFASFSDASSGNSNLSNAEGFLDAAGTTGTGFVFIANDGNFNSPAESGYADIPLPVVNTLSAGAHPICVHAKDASGNWGAVDCSYSLTIDRTPPAISSINRVDANPANNGSVHFLVTFSESVTGVAASNFTIVRTGLTGTSTITSVTGGGNTRTVTATTGNGAGTLGLNLSSAAGIADLAGNALPSAGLPFVGQVYTIQPPPQPALYFSTFGSTNPPGVGGTADDADIYFYNGTAFSRNVDVTAITNPLPTGANVDGFDRVDATHFYMSFNGQVNVPGIGNVQDEDVVYYSAGTWSLFFDGSVNGVTSNLDAISIVGGNLYFSLSTNTTPPGVTGPAGDDADIYRWNGGSSYTRMFDATANGLATTANVDGFVRVDATHFYLSFADPVALPGGAGTAQDEDVVFYNAGAWSIYFDGSVVGLDASGNLDIDAFDLP